MIEITYGHKYNRTTSILSQKVLAIGYGDGIPSQSDFITIIEEELHMGEVVYANILKRIDPFKTFKRKWERRR